MVAREMKDSNIWGVGQIPSSWTTKRIGYLFKEKTQLSLPEERWELLSVSEYYGVAQKKETIAENDFLTRAESLVGYKVCRPGDLVSNIMLTWKGALGVSDHAGIVSPAYCVYCSNDQVVPRYAHYLFRTKAYTSLFKAYSTGIIDSRLRLYTDKFFKLKCLLPSKNEQTAIVNFLDTKCAEFDSLTADIEKQIETLQEYKKSVITEAVTKGLDPNVEMKDSGVEWIGKVPMHWKTTRLKNEILNLDYLREPISAEKRKNEQGLYDYYGASGVIDKIDDYNVNDTVLLIGEDGANLLMRNLPLIYKASGKFWVNNHAHILKVPSKNDYEYFAFLLEAVDYTNFITGSAQPKLSQRNLDNVPLIIPNVEEQRHISEYLSERCADIELVVGEKQKQLEVLAQYKQSLIYEYVTGKKAVPT